VFFAPHNGEVIASPNRG